jgi:hypothetical protein
VFIIISILFGVRWFFGNEGNQPTFVMKAMRGAKQGGEQISNRSQKKNFTATTPHNINMMMIMRRDRSYYNRHAL